MREFEQYFECYRCSYVFYLKTDMQRHLSKKYPCYWSGKNKEESDEEIVLKKSLQKHYRKKEDLWKKYKEIQESNKELSTNTLKTQCEFCKKKFKSKLYKNAHLMMCKMKKIIQNELENNEKPVLEEKEEKDKTDFENVYKEIKNTSKDIQINYTNIINIHINDKFDFNNLFDKDELKNIMSNFEIKICFKNEKKE